MNESDIDKLIDDGLKVGKAGEVFRQGVLRESSMALVRSRASRNRLRVAGLTLCVMLIVAGAFACGQLSVPRQVLPKQEGWTKVPGDLVAWLDAGRFFEQLGMDERAERAYQMASEFIPGRSHEINQARLNSSKSLLRVLGDVQMHSRPTGFVERESPAQAVTTEGRTLEWSNKNPSLFEIIAQYLRG